MADTADDIFQQQRRLSAQDAPPAPPIAPAAPALAVPVAGDPTSVISLDQFRQMLAANRAQTAAALQKSERAASSISNEPVNIPAPPQLAPTPKADLLKGVTDPMKAMQSPMMILALLAGGLSGRGISGAFASGAAFVNGIKEGNTETIKKNQQQFNDDLNSVIKSNTDKLEQYNAVLADARMTMDEKSSRLRAVAMQHDDAIALAQLDNGDIKSLAQYAAAQANAQRTVMQHQEQMNMQVARGWKQATLALTDGTYVSGQKNQLTNQYRDDSGKPIDPGKVKDTLFGVPTEGLISPDSADFKAKMAWRGDYKDAVSGLGLGNVASINRNILTAAIQKEGVKQNKSPDEIANAILKFDSEVQSARVIGRVVGSTAQGAQELQQFAPIVKELSDKIDRTQYPNVNAIELAIRRGTGDPDVVELESYIQSLRNAYAQVMSRGGRMTDQGSRYAAKLIDGSLTTDQIPAALDAFTTEANVAQASAQRALQEATGQPVTAPNAQRSTQYRSGAGSGGAQFPKVLRYDSGGNLIQ